MHRRCDNAPSVRQQHPNAPRQAPTGRPTPSPGQRPGFPAFLEFVLAHYINVGVDELAPEKLSPLLRLKYNAISDAIKDLGQPEDIKNVFTGFQKYLYVTESAA
jgi:EcoEI R protein C-terminal